MHPAPFASFPRGAAPRRSSQRVAAAAGSLAAALGAVAAPPAYVVVDLGTLAGPGEVADPGSFAAGISVDGRVVGTSVTNGPHHEFFGFRRAAGTVVGLPPLAGDEHSVATAVNAAGDAVGMSYALAALATHGVRWSASGGATSLGTFVPRALSASGVAVGQIPVAGAPGVTRAGRWDSGVVTDLGTLGGASSSAAGISADGWIVGASRLANATGMHAFLWRQGVLTDLGTLGGSDAWAEAINDSHQVVGTSRTAAGALRATLWTLDAGGQVVQKTDLGLLGGGASSALAISQDGVVVGASGDSAFRWSAGSLVDLNTVIASGSQWTLTRATGVNAAGRIVGEGRHLGLRRAFLLVPRNPADFDANGVVDGADLGQILGHWGEAAPDFDLTGDGHVDGADLGVVLGSWGGYTD